jgi:DNA-binding transcriptional MerR regulator
MRIGELARAAGTTVRTIRYYEEIGLLPAAGVREAGAHRNFTEEDVDALRDVLRLRDLLGLSLDELRAVVADESARPVLREEFWDDGTGPARRTQILDEFEAILDRQAELLERRRTQLDELHAELLDRRERIATRREELRAASSSARG